MHTGIAALEREGAMGRMTMLDRVHKDPQHEDKNFVAKVEKCQDQMETRTMNEKM